MIPGATGSPRASIMDGEDLTGARGRGGGMGEREGVDEVGEG